MEIPLIDPHWGKFLVSATKVRDSHKDKSIKHKKSFKYYTVRAK